MPVMMTMNGVSIHKLFDTLPAGCTDEEVHHILATILKWALVNDLSETEIINRKTIDFLTNILKSDYGLEVILTCLSIVRLLLPSLGSHVDKYVESKRCLYLSIVSIMEKHINPPIKLPEGQVRLMVMKTIMNILAQMSNLEQLSTYNKLLAQEGTLTWILRMVGCCGIEKGLYSFQHSQSCRTQALLEGLSECGDLKGLLIQDTGSKYRDVLNAHLKNQEAVTACLAQGQYEMSLLDSKDCPLIQYVAQETNVWLNPDGDPVLNRTSLSSRIKVTHVINPQYMFIHRGDKSEIVADYVAKYVETAAADGIEFNVKPPAVGSIVCMYKEGHLGMRGKVLAVKGSRVNVFAIDYGDVFEFPWKQTFYPTQEEKIHVLPPCAVLCYVPGVYPAPVVVTIVERGLQTICNFLYNHPTTTALDFPENTNRLIRTAWSCYKSENKLCILVMKILANYCRNFKRVESLLVTNVLDLITDILHFHLPHVEVSLVGRVVEATLTVLIRILSFFPPARHIIAKGQGCVALAKLAIMSTNKSLVGPRLLALQAFKLVIFTPRTNLCSVMAPSTQLVASMPKPSSRYRPRPRVLIPFYRNKTRRFLINSCSVLQSSKADIGIQVDLPIACALQGSIACPSLPDLMHGPVKYWRRTDILQSKAAGDWYCKKYRNQATEQVAASPVNYDLFTSGKPIDLDSDSDLDDPEVITANKTRDQREQSNNSNKTIISATELYLQENRQKCLVKGAQTGWITAANAENRQTQHMREVDCDTMVGLFCGFMNMREECHIYLGLSKDGEVLGLTVGKDEKDKLRNEFGMRIIRKIFPEVYPHLFDIVFYPVVQWYPQENRVVALKDQYVIDIISNASNTSRLYCIAQSREIFLRDRVNKVTFLASALKIQEWMVKRRDENSINRVEQLRAMIRTFKKYKKQTLG